MLNASNVIAFVATTNSERARAFYEGTLGLTLMKDSPFALVFDAHGVILRVQEVQSLNPASHTTLGWRVSDIRRMIVSLAQDGVVFERYARLSQDQLGIWSSPSGAQVAWFKDPDGNVLSLTQFQNPADHARWGAFVPPSDLEATDSVHHFGCGARTKLDHRESSREPRPCHPENYTRTELMKRVFELDFLPCDRCGGRMTILAPGARSKPFAFQANSFQRGLQFHEPVNHRRPS
jgi:catechol 2,3-dioxygenase-like lactoylglutathione lyase family enzyme